MAKLDSTKLDYEIFEDVPGQYKEQYETANGVVGGIVYKGLRNNVVGDGGIVAINLPAPGNASVRVGVRGSCCARESCRACFLANSEPTCRYWEDGAPGCLPECLPIHPSLGIPNVFCCCFGIDTFPLQYMGMCIDSKSPFFSPRTDGFRARYVAYRNTNGESVTDEVCDSSHVRAVNRWVQFRQIFIESLSICTDIFTNPAVRAVVTAVAPSIIDLCSTVSVAEDTILAVPPAIFNYTLGQHIPKWNDIYFADVVQLSIPGYVPWGSRSAIASLTLTAVMELPSSFSRRRLSIPSRSI